MLCGQMMPWPFRLLLVVVLALAAGFLVVCGEMPNPEGVDSDRELTWKDDGLVYRIGEDTPYTGKAYCTMFNDERSSIWGMSLHWQGEFKDGKRHGTWLLPAEHIGLVWGDDWNVVRVEFRDGVEVADNNQP
jgi:hypothetical protein